MENSKHQIFPNGSLNVQRLTESDQGDYTCTVGSNFGSDQIMYELIVQIPPVPPEIQVANVTFDAVLLTWRGIRSRKQPVLGYTINFRREHGQWRRTDTHPLTDYMWLDTDMMCGSNYTIYMTAYNHIGHGHPSGVVYARTRGRVPDIPNPARLMEVNKTLITVHLDAFGTGGCPILYFVIEYRRDIQPKYTMVANNISPRKGSYTIRGLDPGTQYFIKVTAHNTAG